ncbi:DUF3168 domain-containing protein [Acidovorax sp.]|uniref:tail completion protein gp17 n=1 Tax=Acidovorax sp. TaxID=1872122 RepID=UPI0025BF5092|nr:DUF3168 domain-containing protein [Acidovorax sp.]MBL7090832.1 DUF3168 domain-containing protein [Acidovorax sp.]
MSAEATLHALLAPLVSGKAWPDVAHDTVLPRIVFQQISGRTINYTEGTLPDKENARMQIACWAASRASAIALMKQAEALILAEPTFQAEALGARSSVVETDVEPYVYGCRQDFSIWTAR